LNLTFIAERFKECEDDEFAEGLFEVLLFLRVKLGDPEMDDPLLAGEVVEALDGLVHLVDSPLVLQVNLNYVEPVVELFNVLGDVVVKGLLEAADLDLVRMFQHAELDVPDDEQIGTLDLPACENLPVLLVCHLDAKGARGGERMELEHVVFEVEHLFEDDLEVLAPDSDYLFQ